MRALLGLVFVMLISAKVISQSVDFEAYDPPSTLVVEEHKVTRAKFPFIDIHNHQFRMGEQDLNILLAEMDKLNMAVMVNLSGRGMGSQEHLIKAIENTRRFDAKRFVVFTNLNMAGFGEPDWTEKALKALEEDVKYGAKGLKIYKSLGMRNVDNNGKLVSVDDPRLDPVWAKCGALGIPVLIHTADPKSFWDPFDENNERWLELKTHPGRRMGESEVDFEELIQAQHNIFKRHSQTKFINAHMGWYPNDLKKLGELLDEMPNMYVEIGAVIAELGRQPREAYKFMIKYQDRVLFGKDSWVPDEYQTYFRVLETEDDYFPYHKRYHAFWRMYGLGLPDEVLKKIYYKNALSLLPGMDASAFPR